MELDNFDGRASSHFTSSSFETSRPASVPASGQTFGFPDQNERLIQNTGKTTPSPWNSLFARLWWIETLCCVLSIGAIVAIAAILRVYDRHSQPNWYYEVTISSLLSVFVLVLKTPMLFVIAEGIGQMKWLWFRTPRSLSNLSVFDSASRGAYGSARLLYLLRIKHLASIGAAVMLLAVAIGPFTQQSVKYYPCLQLSPNMTSSVSRSQDYMPFEELLMANWAIKASILEGIFAPTGNVSYSCPTGFCTFEKQYTSIGVCHTCRNAVYDLEKNCKTNSSSGEVLCGLALKNGLSVYAIEPVPSDDTTNAYVPMVSASQVADPTGVFAPATGLGFANFSMIALTRDDCSVRWTTNNFSRDPQTDCAPASMINGTFNVMAAECILSYCVYTYEAKVDNGVMDERILSTSGTVLQNGENNYFPGLIEYDGVGTWWENFYALLANPCYLDGSPQSIHNITPALPQDNSSFPDDTNYGWALINEKNITIPRECVYAVIADRALETLLNSDVGFSAFSPMFNGSAVSFVNEDSVWVDFDPLWLEPLFDNWYSSFLKIDAIFATVAFSMTTQMRQMQNSSSHAIGTVSVSETCVRVSWPWLVLPTVLVLVSCVFLALVISQTANAFHPSWKSEPLPLLFIGLGDRLCESLGARDEIEDMQEVAAARVVLLRSEERWRFAEGIVT